jgi:hypothetical protein
MTARCTNPWGQAVSGQAPFDRKLPDLKALFEVLEERRTSGADHRFSVHFCQHNAEAIRPDLSSQDILSRQIMLIDPPTEETISVLMAEKMTLPQTAVATQRKGKSFAKLVKSSIKDSKISQAARLINLVHGVTVWSSTIEVVRPAENDEREGSFLGGNRKDRSELNVIAIHPKARNVLMTFIHEVGHYADKRLIRSSTYGSETAYRLAVWRQTVENSAATKRMREGILVDDRLRKDKKFRTSIAYNLEPCELFARSYAQWIICRCGDEGFQAEMAEVRKKEPRTFPFYWSDEDFEPIGLAFDVLFAELGLLTVLAPE